MMMTMTAILMVACVHVTYGVFCVCERYVRVCGVFVCMCACMSRTAPRRHFASSSTSRSRWWGHNLKACNMQRTGWPNPIAAGRHPAYGTTPDHNPDGKMVRPDNCGAQLIGTVTPSEKRSLSMSRITLTHIHAYTYTHRGVSWKLRLKSPGTRLKLIKLITD